MNKLLTAVLLSAAAFSAPLHAEVRTYDASFTVNIVDRNGSPLDTLRDQNGIEHALGDVIVARFVFDDTALIEASKVTQGGGGSFSVNGMGTMSVSFHGGAQTSGPFAATWQAARGDFGDTFYFSGAERDPDTSNDLHTFGLQMYDNWDLPPSENTPTPYSLDPAGFSGGRSLRMLWIDADGVAYVDGKMTSLVEVSPVPEPSAYAMLLAGALVVGGAARARRARKV